MRRRFSILLFVLGPLCAPTGLYELLQKSGERAAAPQISLFALSTRAELETPWRPRTRSALVNHAVHELQETGRFLILLGRSI